MKSVGNLVVGLIVAGLCQLAQPVALAAAPAAQVTRSVLLRQDLDIPGREVVMVAVEIPPGVAEDLHTHAAELFAYVVQGEMIIERQGQPPKTIRPGETFHVAAGTVHRGINHGAVAVKISTVFVAQKGKPLTSPAP